jgi:AAA+ ATPase superfamily predicted ATPase
MWFIEKEILAEKNPLYGRATGILKMTEMSFYDAIQFVPRYSALDKIAAYAVLGGIPHYLKQFDDTLSLGENIRKNILSRGSILYSEVEFLMRQELRETAIYNAIIEAVSLGNTKLNSIHQKTQIEKTKLSAYLKNLVDLGILRREFPVSDGVKEQANVQRGLYQVTDNFFRFWYAFVFPNLSELEAGDAEGIWEHVVEPALDEYTSRIFEDVCRQYLRVLNRKKALPFYFTKIGRWWDKANEIDIMATDSKKQNFLLGECKYRNSVVTLADLTALREKFVPKKDAGKVYYCLFSKSGFAEDVVGKAKAEGVMVITTEEVVMPS